MYLAEMARKQDLGGRNKIPDDDMAFLVDLTGDWTLCTLPYKYTIFIGECTRLPMYARVKNWEQKLRKLLPSCDIYRIDKLLLDPWEVRYDYLLVRHPEAVQIG